MKRGHVIAGVIGAVVVGVMLGFTAGREERKCTGMAVVDREGRFQMFRVWDDGIVEKRDVLSGTWAEYDTRKP